MAAVGIGKAVVNCECSGRPPVQNATYALPVKTPDAASPSGPRLDERQRPRSRSV